MHFPSNFSCLGATGSQKDGALSADETQRARQNRSVGHRRCCTFRDRASRMCHRNARWLRSEHVATRAAAEAERKANTTLATIRGSEHNARIFSPPESHTSRRSSIFGITEGQSATQPPRSDPSYQRNRIYLVVDLLKVRTNLSGFIFAEDEGLTTIRNRPQ